VEIAELPALLHPAINAGADQGFRAQSDGTPSFVALLQLDPWIQLVVEVPATGEPALTFGTADAGLVANRAAKKRSAIVSFAA